MMRDLYSPDYEHDACGVGMLADLNGNKTHQTVADALTMIENMKHRGAEGADGKTGDVEDGSGTKKDYNLTVTSSPNPLTNYTITETNDTFNLNKAELTIDTKNIETTYGTVNKNYETTVTGGEEAECTS